MSTKFSLWKYLVIIISIAIGIVYTIPNFYGDTPALQITGINDSYLFDQTIITNIDVSLAQIGVLRANKYLHANKLIITFDDIDTQLKAKDIITQNLGDNYNVTLNLISSSPAWLHKINADAMLLGLDLRGGIHFLFSLDMQEALRKTFNGYLIEIKQILRNNKIHYTNSIIKNQHLSIQFKSDIDMQTAYLAIKKNITNLQIIKKTNTLNISLSALEIQKIQEMIIKQNILILHNRINELGVNEPVIQQQGLGRILIELPGLQDTARAKSIIGRTALLEIHLVNDDIDAFNSANKGNPPIGYELINDTNKQKVLVNKDVELTGDGIVDASPGFDENGNPAINIKLNNVASNIFKQLTASNVGKRLAMVLIDNGKSEVITAPVVRTAISGGQVQISGSMNINEANDTALLLRSGSLAAPMILLEERTIGPSLGKENIAKGVHAVLGGFIAIAIFMVIYYLIFGVIAVISLSVNLLLLIAVLSMLQATLTLPGIAAIALTLGMAIDANVLINERIREELRFGHNAYNAIQMGYKYAFATILDSNITTLIAGLALLAFGSGPIKGFAIVHCLGILTSIFSAVFVSRGIVSLIYRKRNINKIFI